MEYIAPLGPVYQAGTLSGNPLAMAAGVAALKMIRENPPYEALEKKSKFIVSAVREAASKKGIAIQTPMAASLFSFFFNENEVVNYETALKSSAEFYKKFFKSCLDNGVYLAPSAFEICFMSASHTEADLQKAAEVMGGAIETL